MEQPEERSRIKKVYGRRKEVKYGESEYET